jgi:plasmid stabilization system protein ParE
MGANLVITPEAKDDLDDAYTWYELRGVGLGEVFLVEVDACIESIVRMPSRNALVRGNYRRALVSKFPYAVFYEIADENSTIYAALHTARNPDVTLLRLP